MADEAVQDVADIHAEHDRQLWEQSVQALQIRKVLETKTDDQDLIEHLLHQASWPGRHSVNGEDLIENPEAYAETLWLTHQDFPAYSGVMFEQIRESAREFD